MHKFHKTLYMALLLLLSFLLLFPMNSGVILGQEEEIQREKAFIVRMTMTFGTGNYNPYTIQYGQLPADMVPIAEPLFIYDGYTGKVFNILATGWEWTDESRATARVFLNPDAEWSDGEPFTAEDVVFTFDMLMAHPGLPNFPVGLSVVTDVSAVDDHTVLVNLNRTEAGPRWTIPVDFNFYPVPEHIWKDVDPETFTNSENPVFTGPYTVYHESEQLYIFKRRDDYWGADQLGDPVEWIIFKFIGTMEGAVQAWLAHEVDFDQAFDADTISDLEAEDPYFYIVWAPDACATAVNINNLRYPLNMSEFRWAINYAINRTRIIEFIYKGVSPYQPVPFTDSPGMMRWIDWNVVAEHNITEYPNGNPKLAIKMLEDLGFTRDAEGWFRYPNGTRITLDLVNAPADWVEWFEFGKAVAEDLRAIGLDVQDRGYDVSVYIDRWESRDYDLLSGSTVCEYEDPFTVFSHQRSDFPAYGWWGNTEGYNNSEFDQLVDQWAKIPSNFDDPRAREIHSKLLEIWLTDLPAIPVTVYRYPKAYSEYYWSGFPSPEDPYVYPGIMGEPMYVLLRHIKSTGRLPAGLINDPIFGRISETSRNTYYGGIAVVVVIAVAASVMLLKRRKT